MAAIAHRTSIERLETRTLFSVLKVGPTEPYKEPSAAIAAAHDGDTILIDPGTYNDVALINKNNLTIEGDGPVRSVIKTNGAVYGEKGLWVFQQGFKNLTVDNIDFEGARVSVADGNNGAGIRDQGTNLTILNCRFYNNQDGILGGNSVVGGLGTVTIKNSEFADNGITSDGLTHNVYISDRGATLIFEFNYTHNTVVGHLLKSRCAVNEILYNRISDDTGTGSYEIDLPNGGRDDIVGNIIQQSATSQNKIIVSYGEEGSLIAGSQLNVVNNTIVNDATSGTFILAKNLPTGFRVDVKNNIFAGPGTPLSVNGVNQSVTGNGNVVTTVAGAKFVNAAAYNFQLLAGSPAINVGVAPGTDSAGFSLTPVDEYVFPTDWQKRPVNGQLDAGAYEFV